jgi:hypothetical protein
MSSVMVVGSPPLNNGFRPYPVQAGLTVKIRAALKDVITSRRTAQSRLVGGTIEMDDFILGDCRINDRPHAIPVSAYSDPPHGRSMPEITDAVNYVADTVLFAGTALVLASAARC